MRSNQVEWIVIAVLALALVAVGLVMRYLFRLVRNLRAVVSDIEAAQQAGLFIPRAPGAAITNGTREMVVIAPGDGPKHRFGPFALPSFGKPRLTTFFERDYDERMFCAGQNCGRAITEGEQVHEIPLTGRDDGAVLLICLPCSGKSLTHD